MTSPWRPQIVRSRPDDGTIARIVSLASAARAADGSPPLSDQTLVSLRSGDTADRRVITVLAAGEDGSTPAGAAVLVLGGTGDDDPGLLELVVHPARRGSGLGSALLAAFADLPDLASAPGSPGPDSAAGPLAWSHGDHPAARVLAAAHRYTVVRELWRMSAPVAAVAPVDAASIDPGGPGEGIRLRSFQPGDEAALLALNAAAFAHHPEQGSLSATDLADLMAQDWFDAEGLFLAEREADGELLGFHWTKVDPTAPHEGEVYVLGVSPAAQSLGLGRVLTAAGLAHLRRRGVDTITLYVDADNAPAVRLYTAVGFGRADVDVLYAPTAAPAGRQ